MDTLQRRLVAAVVALGLLALIGMAVLWPTPIDVAVPEPPGPEATGRIVAIEEYLQEQPAGFGFSPEAARIDIELLDGEFAGEVVLVDTFLEGYPDFDPGDRVRLVAIDLGGELEWNVVDFERGTQLWWLVALFALVVVAVGRWHGLRSLLGLVLSLLVVVAFVVPAILGGASPPAVAFFGALAIMLVTLPLAHGVNPMTGAAIVGTSVALGVTILLGTWFIELAHLTGFSSEEANLARFAIEGLDPKGLVLAGLIIAALGVLDDVTVSQASTVFALRSANPNLDLSALFARAMNVGRDHIASTVNTLVLAYVGASLALLVLFSTSGVPAGELVTSEVLAEEIVKTLVGSIGLISAVPLTTALAASLAVRTPPDGLAAMGHGHHHHHSPTAPAAVGAGASPDVAADGEDEEDYERMINELKWGSSGPPSGDGPAAG